MINIYLKIQQVYFKVKAVWHFFFKKQYPKIINQIKVLFFKLK